MASISCSHNTQQSQTLNASAVWHGVHVPGITVTNAQDAAHGNDGMAVDARAVPGIVQPQQSNSEMRYIAWQFDAHFLE